MKIKFREKDGEVYLFTDFFDLKLTRTRQVMIKHSGENQFNVIEGVESVRGSSIDSKQHFLLHIAHGVHYKILQDEESESKQPSEPTVQESDDEVTDEE